MFQWHGDTFVIPEGDALLAEGRDCRNQLFRRGNAVAVQFHNEVTAADADAWAVAYADELSDVGKTREQVVAECRAREAPMKELAFRMLDNFFALSSI